MRHALGTVYLRIPCQTKGQWLLQTRPTRPVLTYEPVWFCWGWKRRTGWSNFSLIINFKDNVRHFYTVFIQLLWFTNWVKTTSQKQHSPAPYFPQRISLRIPSATLYAFAYFAYIFSNVSVDSDQSLIIGHLCKACLPITSLVYRGNQLQNIKLQSNSKLQEARFSTATQTTLNTLGS